MAALARTAEITTLLKAWSGGDPAALDRLTPLLYDELRRLARGYLRRERGGQTLQATALVNEAYLRLVDVKGVNWQDRTLHGGCGAHHAAHSGGCGTHPRVSQAWR